mgnify:CR=1 FL=1
MDNITICGHDQASHDKNLKEFYDAASKYKLTFNDSKSIISQSSICLLGYQITKGEIKPDPEQLQPLMELLPPKYIASQKRVLGMFSYYSQWIPIYSKLIQPLITNDTFPMPPGVVTAFESIKKAIENSVITTIDSEIPLVVETDASDNTIVYAI